MNKLRRTSVCAKKCTRFWHDSFLIKHACGSYITLNVPTYTETIYRTMLSIEWDV